MSTLKDHLSESTIIGLKLWVLIAISVGIFILASFLILVMCLNFRAKKRVRRNAPLSHLTQIPPISKEIKEVRINSNAPVPVPLPVAPNSSNTKAKDLNSDVEGSTDTESNSSSFRYNGKEGEKGGAYQISVPSPLTGLPEMSYLGWGHWFTLRDLEMATNRFSKDNVLGEGGYGVVYRGQLINGTQVAIKKLLNNS
jgi:hypothetical protein